MKEGLERGQSETEIGPVSFNWRDYVRQPKNLSPESVKQLETLSDLLNHDPHAEEFLKPLRAGQFKGPLLLAFVNFFRDALTPDERARLFDDIGKAEPTGHFNRKNIE